jgi:hypothetical protein
MDFNLYFSLCGESCFQLLRELFLLIFGSKNSKRYQIAVSDFGTHFASKSTSDDRHDGDSKRGYSFSPLTTQAKRSRELNGESDYS